MPRGNEKVGFGSVLARVMGVTVGPDGKPAARVLADNGQNVTLVSLSAQDASLCGGRLFNYVLVVGRATWFADRLHEIAADKVTAFDPAVDLGIAEKALAAADAPAALPPLEREKSGPMLLDPSAPPAALPAAEAPATEG